MSVTTVRRTANNQPNGLPLMTLNLSPLSGPSLPVGAVNSDAVAHVIPVLSNVTLGWEGRTVTLLGHGDVDGVAYSIVSCVGMFAVPTSSLY